ncbi:hypothetical protein LEMLEM_LOCUS682, partial [Lemmus lemmus]
PVLNHTFPHPQKRTWLQNAIAWSFAFLSVCSGHTCSHTDTRSPLLPESPCTLCSGRMKKEQTRTVDGLWRHGLHQIFCSLLWLLQQSEDQRVAEVQAAHGVLHGGGQRVWLQLDDCH